MRKPEKSIKRRKAALKRAINNNKRNSPLFRKEVVAKKLLRKRKAKEIADRKFKEHLKKLFGQ